MNIRDFCRQFKINIRNEDLISNAFIHKSYVNENKDLNLSDNERLELLGDAVLQLWSANFLYHIEPEISEGDMTLTRALLVNEKALSTYSKQIGLGQFICLGAGELKNQGQLRDSLLADLFEAFIGALYLDCGFEALNPLLSETIVNRFHQLDKDDLMDYKTKLQEFVQSDTRKTVTYEIISMTGPANQPEFEAVVKLDDIVLGKGKGSSKKRAHQQAAKDALNKMVK